MYNFYLTKSKNSQKMKRHVCTRNANALPLELSSRKGLMIDESEPECQERIQTQGETKGESVLFTQKEL